MAAPQRRVTTASDAAERPLAIVDIDGVVADVRHRLHHLTSRPPNWAGFFDEARHDEPHPEGLDVVAALAADHEIVFLTGRPARLERDTVAWLERHGLGGHRLVMRPEGDWRPAARVKVELLHELARDREVAIVIDDDVTVLEAMADAGYPTRLADWEPRRRDEDLALYLAQEEEGRT